MFSSLKFSCRCFSSRVKRVNQKEINLRTRVFATVATFAHQSINQTAISGFDFTMADSQGDKLRSKVYVYSGYGCSDQGSKMLTAALNRHVDKDHHDVVHISPEDILKGNWTQDAQVFVIGGGFDLGFIKSLGEEGVQLIHDYVWQTGGNYLGICAGAYFASDRIEFDKGGPLEVCGERYLKFYPGNCIGPAYPGFAYNSSAGAEGAPLDVSCYRPWADIMESSSTINVYIQGGGFFTPPDDYLKSDSGNLCENTESKSLNGQTNGTVAEKVSTEIIAKFKDLPDTPAAIVKCCVGSNGGKAILSCAHFEYDPELLNKEDPTLRDSVKYKVTKSDSNRQLILNAIFKELGIKTNGNIRNNSLL